MASGRLPSRARHDARRRPLLRLLVPFAALLGVLALPAGASAEHVQCGDVITGNVKLDSDLTCPAQGLIVGANGVKIDLGGQTLSGPGGSLGDDPFEGVRADGRSDLLVRNGTIRGFTTSVLLTATSSSVVRGIAFRDGLDGIVVQGGRNVVSRNTGNAGFTGIRAEGDSPVVERNSIAAEFAITVEGDNPWVTRNRADCSIRGIEVRNYRAAVISRNVVDRPCITGFFLFGRDGVIERNTALFADVGLRIQDPSGEVRRNVANQNFDGIVIETPGTTVTRNTANLNQNWGIFAPGAIDGGGNRASGNGVPEQCFGVRCR